ncbi:MAG: hypothetical protein PHC66_01245 [Candidatus Nanoarchaeia archaeon]|nr:hypothetical protein [Candidatus Nanoarchaeia archaeon]MDD5239119.1 hypothetical protein [Candidatus Nanoarchaeia archaeon]
MGILNTIKTLFTGNPKSEGIRFEKETKTDSSMFSRVISECSEAHALLKDAVSSFKDPVVDKWKLANLAKLQIKLVELKNGLNNLGTENSRILALANRLSAKFPDDKAFEKKVRIFKKKLDEKSAAMIGDLSDFLGGYNMSDVATKIRKGETPVNYNGVFGKCSTALKNISAEAEALQASLAKLYALEKKYLSG